MITRDDAWICLRDLTLDKTTPYFSTFMFRLLSYLFRDEIPKMAPQDFSAASMEMLHRMLVDNARSEQIRLEFDHLLDLPMWLKLVDIAELACEPRIREIAIMNMSMVLFDMPHMQNSSKINQVHVESCHTRFIQERIDRLHRSYALIDSSPADAKQLVLQQIDLLSFILNKSKKTAADYNQSKPLEICLAADAEATLSYTLELFIGLGPKYQSIAMKAAPSAKVSDLVGRLPVITNTMENRIIISGREVDQANEEDKLLKDIVTQPSRKMAVCPRYNFDSDISFTYGQIGVVERELLHHYDRLETLLHGPPAIARKVCLFFFNGPHNADVFSGVTIFEESSMSNAREAASRLPHSHD
jgi:ubiquitin carboxyl-terminal hydrolase 34